MAISISDWINITIGIVMFVTTSSFGILQLMAMRPKTKPTESHPTALAISNRTWFIHHAWPFMFSSLVAIWFMWQALSADGEVTRSFVISLLFGVLLLSANILAMSVYAVVAVFRHNMQKDT